jgi:hypothetical protein
MVTNQYRYRTLQRRAGGRLRWKQVSKDVSCHSIVTFASPSIKVKVSHGVVFSCLHNFLTVYYFLIVVVDGFWWQSQNEREGDTLHFESAACASKLPSDSTFQISQSRMILRLPLTSLLSLTSAFARQSRWRVSPSSNLHRRCPPFRRCISQLDTSVFFRVIPNTTVNPNHVYSQRKPYRCL